MYAVIRTGGKQYRVEPGHQVRVDRLTGDVGDTVELSEVLMFSSEGSLDVGTPCVENARVVASIVQQGRGKKINVFKYKSKVRYRKLRGHRQHHTDLRVEELVGPDGTSYKHEKKERPVEVVAEESVAEDEVEAAVDELVAVDESVDDDGDEAGLDAGEAATNDEASEDDNSDGGDSDEADAEDEGS